MDFASAFDLPNPAIAAKERVRAILEKQAEDVLNGTSSVKEARVKKPKTVQQKREKTFRSHTEDLLSPLGYTVVIVDWYDAINKRKHDFLGFADLLAMKANEPAIAIQICAKGDMSTRRKKIKESKLAKRWHSTGNRILLIGWDMPRHRWEATQEFIEL